MTFANWTYIGCGDDDFALSFTCNSIPSWSVLQVSHWKLHAPTSVLHTVQCSNGITCQNPSIFTSIFWYYQKILTMLQTQTSGKSYILTDPRHAEQHDRYPDQFWKHFTFYYVSSAKSASPNHWHGVLPKVSAISLQNIVVEFLRVDRLELKGGSFSADTF